MRAGNHCCMCLKKNCDPKKHCPAPPDDDVFNMFQVLDDASVPNLGTLPLPLKMPEDLVLENVKDLSVPINSPISGLFGYNPDGSFNATGGKFYTDAVLDPSFKMDFRIHNPNSVFDAAFTQDNIMDCIPNITDYFTARGFPLIEPDTSSVNDKSFNWKGFYGFFSNNTPVINIKPHYDSPTDSLPSAIDVAAYNPSSNPDSPVASGSIDVSIGIVGYNPDEVNRDKRFGYPYRVPLTQNKRDFKCKCRRGIPIVFYNEITQQLIFSVNNIDHVLYHNPNYSVASRDSQTFEDYTAEIRMTGFEGKFQLTKRSLHNKLIPSSFANADMLIQTSESVDIKCTVFNELDTPQLQDTSYSRTYRNDRGDYIGVIARLINGGSPAFDIYSLPYFAPTAFAVITDPFISPENLLASLGDNTSTIGTEALGAPSKMTLIETAAAILFSPYLGESFLSNPPIPEDVGTYPSPVYLPKPPASSVISHEYVHNMHLSLGNVSLLDAEAQATAMEFETELNLGSIFTARADDLTEYVVLHSRGMWNIGQNDLDNVGTPEYVKLGTYGGAMWWRWLSRRVGDLNHQVMRRSGDILAQESTSVIPFVSGTLMSDVVTSYYGGVNRLAQQQALQELYSLDLSEIYKEFAISMALIRNNSGIPSQYRSHYPYWINQIGYGLNAILCSLNFTSLLSGGAVPPVSRFWWGEFDTNASPSIAASDTRLDVSSFPSPYNDLTIDPQLKALGAIQIQLRDLASNIFVIDESVISSVSVKSDKGRITVTALKYNPSTTTGSLTIDGPNELTVGQTRVFNKASFSGPGLWKLIVSNVEITDFGGGTTGLQNIILPADTSVLFTGEATITSS